MKKIFITLICLSAILFATAIKIPMDPKLLSQDKGGLLPAIQAYKDGVGIVVLGDLSGDVVNNEALNQLVYKYGNEAEDSGKSVSDYVLDNSGLLPQEDVQKAEDIVTNNPIEPVVPLEGTGCSDGNGYTENDKYDENGVCLGICTNPNNILHTSAANITIDTVAPTDVPTTTNLINRNDYYQMTDQEKKTLAGKACSEHARQASFLSWLSYQAYYVRTTPSLDMRQADVLCWIRNTAYPYPPGYFDSEVRSVNMPAKLLCKAGLSYNSTDNNCVGTLKQCPSGYSLNGSVCEKVTATCPENYDYHPTDGNCQMIEERCNFISG